MQLRLTAATACCRRHQLVSRQQRNIAERLQHLLQTSPQHEQDTAALLLAVAKRELAEKELLHPDTLAWRPDLHTPAQHTAQLQLSAASLSSFSSVSSPLSIQTRGAVCSSSEASTAPLTADSGKASSCCNSAASTLSSPPTRLLRVCSAPDASAWADIRHCEPESSATSSKLLLAAADDGYNYELDADARVLPLSRVRLVGRRCVGRRRVFDLSVPSPLGDACRSFLAEGVVVHNCAGSMADVFESIAAEIIGTMILGAALAEEAGIAHPEPFIFFPLLVHSLDLLVSGVGIMLVRPRSDSEDPIVSMQRSYAVCMLAASIGFCAACRICLYCAVAPAAWWHFALCGLIGIAMSFGLIRVTQYYTDYSFSPVKRIAAASLTGHGTNVIAGLSVGLESTGLPILIICLSLWGAYTLGASSGLPSQSAGIFGTAVATMGMLCTAVFVLSMNNFGPIADNAGGICEMGGQPEAVRRITDRLDAVGNVTKAASKGYAVGGSALSCFVLFQAFLDEMSDFSGQSVAVVNIARVEVVIGGLLAIAMIFVFAGWSIAAVGSTASKVVWEVRRQLKDRPAILEGTEKPDYATCVRIVTRAALSEMIAPAVLALGLPIAVGFCFRLVGEYTAQPLLGVEVVAAFMIVGTLSGLCMAVFMDNAGGAWDNAKKLIESRGEKGSEQHKAAVTGDTVGDPCKDTAGPAIHVIITTLSTTILVLGPLFVGSNATLSDITHST